MSGAKSDGADAFLLADLLRTDGHRLAPLRPQSDESRRCWYPNGRTGTACSAREIPRSRARTAPRARPICAR